MKTLHVSLNSGKSADLNYKMVWHTSPDSTIINVQNDAVL